ncbi:hypothetical protein JZ785_07525 [Alicyclobacillus curvatus]|nr:hypothetical protein JZ785_07525 [Alicyclobacillus curvatus]
MSLEADAQIVNVKDFFIPGAVDDTLAFQNAIAHAETLNCPVYVPPGSYYISQQLNLNGVSLFGAGFAYTRIYCTAKLGAGVSYINLNPNAIGAPGSNKVSSLLLGGPGSPKILGQRTANCDGISINNSLIVEDVYVAGFDTGIVLNTPSGHASIMRTVSTNNYYSLYIAQDNGDNLIFDCVFSGAAFASIANKPGIPVGGILVIRTHLGMGPYGWYEEQGPVGNSGWLAGGIFEMCRFEGCGNGAIFSENWNTLGGAIVHDLRLNGVGFSWGPNFRLTGRTWDYAVQVGGVFGTMHYVPGKNGFTPGKKGAWYLSGNAAQWSGFLDPADFTIGQGEMVHRQIDEYRSSPPVQGYHYVTDRYWNSRPGAGAPAGWICTRAGYTPTTWAPRQVYTGKYVVPTTPNGHIYKTDYGETGSVEPSWPTTPGTVFYDNPPEGATVWQPDTTYQQNSVVITPPFNGYFYTATTSGTSGRTEPTWPTATHGTVNDNGVIWDAFPVVRYTEYGTAIAEFEPFGTLGT